MAVALGLMPARASLSDINPHVVNFYRWLKRGLRAEIAMRNEQALFYRHRERFNRLVASGDGEGAEAAALFYYLNRTGYNGLCRFNRKGEFNVPFGRYRRINYTTDFSAYRTAFKGWDFSAGDFAALELEPRDFIYADPPYDVEFTQYSKEQVRLGRAGATGGVSRAPSRPRGAVEPGDGADRAAISQARLLDTDACALRG